MRVFRQRNLSNPASLEKRVTRAEDVSFVCRVSVTFSRQTLVGILAAEYGYCRQRNTTLLYHDQTPRDGYNIL